MWLKNIKVKRVGGWQVGIFRKKQYIKDKITIASSKNKNSKMNLRFWLG